MSLSSQSDKSLASKIESIESETKSILLGGSENFSKKRTIVFCPVAPKVLFPS